MPEEPVDPRYESHDPAVWEAAMQPPKAGATETFYYLLVGAIIVWAILETR